MVKPVKRFEIWLVTLDPAEGSETQKTRPCLVVSPDEINRWLRTVIVAPMTTSELSWPSRVAVHFGGKDGQVALDQIRTVDKARLVKKLGCVESQTGVSVSEVLVEMFSL